MCVYRERQGDSDRERETESVTGVLFPLIDFITIVERLAKKIETHTTFLNCFITFHIHQQHMKVSVYLISASGSYCYFF